MEADVVISPVRRSLRLAEKHVAPGDGGHGNYQVSSLAELPDELDIGYISPKQGSFLLVPYFNEWTHLQYIFLSTFPLYNSGLCSFTYIVMLFNHALDPVSCACAVCCKG